MLSKAGAHIRPFIRLPSHSTPPPDHFTANPSLLHHLPHNGSGNALVTQAQNSTQTAGGSGSAGRAGHGGSAGSGGGYTGHARAFLSLPQTASVDPSSTLSNDDNNQQGPSSSQHGLLLRHRLSRRTRIIGPSDGSGRAMRREIEARAGGRVTVLEIEGEDPEGRDDMLLTSGQTRRSRRRSSIAFPQQTAQPLTSGESSSMPRIASAYTPTPPATLNRDPLPRSRSSAEIWQVGIPRRTQLGIRALSTRTETSRSSEAEDITEATPLVSTVPSRSTRILGQPNRVFMDLAGRDIPVRGTRMIHSTAKAEEPPFAERELSRHKTSMVRRNSTAAVERISPTQPPIDLLAAGSRHRGTATPPASKIDAERDSAIVSAILRARDQEDDRLVERLIAHYRSPRRNSPFEQQDAAGHELGQRFPLPSTYSLKAYNTCLGALITLRKSGQSIAPILELYNEILERNIIPTTTTYGLVIRSLAVREKEIAEAAAKWAEEKRWQQWRSERLGVKSYDAHVAAQKDELFERYLAEGNLSSALKLFGAATMMYSNPDFEMSVYGPIFAAMAAQPEPDILGMPQVYHRAKRDNVKGLIRPYKNMFKAFGVAKDVSELERAWNGFNALRLQPGAMESLVTSIANEARLSPETVVARAEGHIREVWNEAIRAFVVAGEPGRAFEIFTEVMGAAPSDSFDITKPPAATHRTCGILLVALAEAGQVDLAVEWYDRIQESGILARSPPHRLALEQVAPLVDALVLAGYTRDAKRILLDFAATNPEFSNERARHTLLKRFNRLYVALVTEGAEADEIMAVINAQPILLDVPVVKKHLALLVGQGRYDDLSAVLDAATPTPVGEQQAHELATLLRQYAASDLPLRPLLSLVRSFARHRIHGSAQASETLLAKYATARGAVASAHDLELVPDAWLRLIEAVTNLTSEAVEEGNVDDVLLQLTEDLAAINTQENDYLYKIQNHTAISQFAQRLAHRFSVDRATQMLAAPFGQSRAEQLTAPSPPPSPLPASAGASDFNGSMSPESATTAPSETSVPQHNLRIDRHLSASVDRFTHRNPPITPLQAYDLVRKGLTENQVPHPETLCRLIDHLARSNEAAKVQELYSLADLVRSTLIQPELQSHNWHLVEDAMLIANCHLGRLEQAGLHRARILEAGLAPTADAYATMIACSKDTTDDALVARELFDESQVMGVRPHLYLYNTIISKLSKARKAEMALELFVHMKEAKIRPSSVTYGAVINACCRVGDAQSAETLFEEMASQPNFHAKVPPFNTMMQFYLQTQPNRERVLHYYNALRRAQVSPSAHTYKLLLDTYATLAPIDLEAMEGVFAELQADRRVHVQGTHWASLISAYGIHSNDMTKALQIFDSIPLHSGSSREAVVWEAVLNVISQRGNIEQLEGMRKRMIDSGTQPTAYVYNVLITGYARAGDIIKAREVFESMGDSVTGVAAPNNHPTLLTSSGHVKPSTTTNNSGIVYREPSTYEAMIRAEIRSGSREMAENVLRRMEERGYPLAVFMRARAAFDEPGLQSEAGAANLGEAQEVADEKK